MKKILILSLVLFTLILSSIGYGDTQSGLFSDVASNHWAAPFITSLKTSEIISGYPDGTFKPQANVKINEFIAMTVKGLGYRYESMSSDWSKPYVDKAIELKIIQDKEFTDYNAQINREQMTSIIVNAVSLSEYRPSSTMDLYIRNETKDYHLIGDYYKQNVLDSYKFGIITGYSDSTFRPKGYSTRAEASAVLSKLINKDLRIPFVKTDARYTMFPVNQLDEFGNDETVEQAMYAPLFNGKPVNEIIDVAEILKTVAKQEGKGYLFIGSDKFFSKFGITGFQSIEMYNSVFELSGYEQTIAYAERSDFGFTVRIGDLSNKYSPYYLGLDKNLYRSNTDALYSTYFYRHYEEQMKPIFQYLFGSDFEKAWSILKTALDHTGEPKTIDVILNGRFLSVSFSADGINCTISLKK